MPKSTHVAKLAFIRRMCLSAESMHIETAKLVAEQMGEAFYVSSTAKLKSKTPKRQAIDVDAHADTLFQMGKQRVTRCEANQPK